MFDLRLVWASLRNLGGAMARVSGYQDRARRQPAGSAGGESDRSVARHLSRRNPT